MMRQALKLLPTVPLLVVFTLACGPGRPSARNATLTADPNPVEGGPGWGTTTVAWDTGDGSWGQVYVFVEGREEVLFVEGPQGVEDAPWIAIGPEYHFRLYAGKDRKVQLVSVTVTRRQP